MIAAKIANMPAGRNWANLPDKKITNSAAADQLNISERSVKSAKKVQSQGTDELNDKVRDAIKEAKDIAMKMEVLEDEQTEMAEREQALIQRRLWWNLFPADNSPLRRSFQKGSVSINNNPVTRQSRTAKH